MSEKVQDKIIQIIGSGTGILGLSQSGRLYKLGRYNQWEFVISSPELIGEAHVMDSK